MLNYKRGFKKWADEKSVSLRHELNLRHYESLSPTVLAKHLGLEILVPSELPNMTNDILKGLFKDNSSWSAVTIGVGKPSLIIHNDTHSFERQNSNIFHEIAHVLCGHEMCEFGDLNCPIPLRKYDEVQENEANWLGFCLHLPVSSLIVCGKKNYTLTQISNAYSASMELVKYRMNVTGLSRRYKLLE
jgi:IrrE N-terminal-like domain